jgi:hypothetical protein
VTRLVSIALILAVSAGCVFVDDRDHNPGGGSYVPPAPVNHLPTILEAASWCSYSNRDRDDVISFEVTATDPDGDLDLVSAWADVYDEASGDLVDSFELYPTDDPEYWFSDWLVRSTNLDCWYPGYVVDLTVYDSLDAYDVATLYPDTYR